MLTWCNGAPQWGGCIQVDSLQPTNGMDTYILTVQNCNPGIDTSQGSSNESQSIEMPVTAWTYNANGCATGQQRGLFKFAGLDSIPANATITSALLSLYGVSSSPTTPQGNSIYPGSPYDSYNSNAVLLERIT